MDVGELVGASLSPATRVPGIGGALSGAPALPYPDSPAEYRGAGYANVRVAEQPLPARFVMLADS